MKRSRVELELFQESLGIGTAVVYPGHPLTVAWVITHVFSDFETASIPDGEFGFSAACRNSDISGAGGNVHNAMSLLRTLRQGKRGLQETLDHADELWASCDDQKTRYPDRWKMGQEQADLVKPFFLARVQDWLKKTASGD